ncbi:MAG: translation initiation factor IF-2 [Spirochaetales bacterium]|nr:translation initiation factor IF-2 [Spirochaetales bacterium]
MSEDQDKKKAKVTLIKHQHQKGEEAESHSSEAPKEKKKVVVVKKKVVVKKSPRPVAKANDAAKDDSAGDAPKQEKGEAKASSAESKPSSSPKQEEKKSSSDSERPAAPRSAGPRSAGPRSAGNTGAPRSAGRVGGPRSAGRVGGAPRDRSAGRVGGYNNDRQGGYNNNRQGGYNNDRQGGYNNNRQGGYNNNRPGGYNNNRPGGYNNNRPGGYNNNRPGGYNNNRPGGYNNRPGGQGGNRPGGYNNRPGGGRPGGGRPGGGSPIPENQGKTGSKKFFSKGKKSSKDYHKKKDESSEKILQYKKKTVNQTNPVPKEIEMMEVITVSELARKLNLKASDLISKLMGMGMMVTINQQIDAETATILADEYGCKVKIVSLYEETLIESDEDKEEDMASRPPIVTVMGHVDHGKTKLLDAIRTTNVVSGEFGGITQHIGAYKVATERGEITFLDTPGHAAFTLMRARGAQITDIVILVVAANDGVMPQTREAINHAKEAGCPIIVAVNKMDLPEANPDKVKQQLSEYGILSEDWGGSNQFCHISALKREGIDELLDTVLLESEMLDLKANWNCRAEGKIIESRVDQGRGTVSTVLIEKGVLKVGDSFVAGIFAGKVRAMFDDHGKKVNEAPPSTPVEIIGITGVPDAGDPFQVTANAKEANSYSQKRQELKKVEEAKNVKKITLDNLYDSIQDGEVQELKVIIKGDVHGSVEALKATLEKLSTKEIRLVCIHAAAGAIIESDVTLAAASNAIIIGFHVRPTAKAQAVAEQEKVEIRKYNIIYDAEQDILQAMEGMLAPEFTEEVVGRVQVREVFKVPKIGLVAGCMVTSGLVTRKSQIHLIREGIEVHTGEINQLKRFKDDAKEVREGFECGISLENYQDIQIGDEMEVFEMKEVARKLGDSKGDE